MIGSSPTVNVITTMFWSFQYLPVPFCILYYYYKEKTPLIFDHLIRAHDLDPPVVHPPITETESREQRHRLLYSDASFRSLFNQLSAG